MVNLTLISEAVKALWANRLRSTLTIIGMVMGITSVIAVVSTVEGMQDNIEGTIRSWGPNTFTVTRFGFSMTMAEYLERLRRKKLVRGLIEPIIAGCPDCKGVGAEGYASDKLKYGTAKMRRVQIEGHTPNILEIREMEVELGRYLSWEDDRRRRRVAFLGYSVYERLFEEGQDPVGERIKIGEREFTVIGVGAKLGSLLGQDLDEYVNIPLSTLQKLYKRPGNPVNIVVRAVSQDKLQKAMDEVRVVLRSARKISYGNADDFTFVTPDAILGFINDITLAFRAILISLPLLSIVVGGIVIMNIMMISVTERTREIGIRKSLGAKRMNIMVQFLYESVILSLIGGLLGIAFGVWAGGAILQMMDVQTTPTTLAILLGFSISTGVGLFFGIYPAMKAARLDPIKALSYE